MSRHRTIPAIAITLLLVAACGGGTATTAPTAAPVAPQSQAPASPASAAPASEAPASEAPASAASAAAGACAPSGTAGTVSVKIANFAFDPQTISAKVGDTVTWTNNDSVQHTATVKSDATCTTPPISGGASSGITFTKAGTYDYFCKIHPTMTGKIEVTG
jgi:plastocyanin